MIENIQQEQSPIVQPDIPTIPTKPRNTKLPYIVALVIIALVSGGGVYFWQQREIKKLQVEQQEVTTDQSNPTTVASPTPVDPRTELSMDEWYKKFEVELEKGGECSNFFETRFDSKPNSFVTYVSDTYQYSIDFPYNYSWGDKTNKVKAYERNSFDTKEISFGRLWFGEACYPNRSDLGELPKSTIEDTIKQIEFENEKLKKENTSYPEDGTSTYKVISNLKYPVLEIDSNNAMYGSVKSVKIFLPNVTLEIKNLKDVLIDQLVNSIKIRNQEISQDTRILLSTKNASEIISKTDVKFDDCGIDFNSEPANEKVLYTNVDKGLELVIPYNKKWGDTKYRIDPYEKNVNGIYFGNMSTVEVCTFVRQYSLSFVDKRSAEAIKQKILSDSRNINNSFKEYTLNSMPVIVTYPDMAGLVYAEFVGNKSNYDFSFPEGSNDQETLTNLKKIASSIKQI